MSFIQSQMTAPLQPLIVADRYSRKASQSQNPTIGQVVLVITDNHTRQLGYVTHAQPDNHYTVILQNDEIVTVPRKRMDIPLENIDQIMARVAEAISNDDDERSDFLDMLLNAEFVPGGRIMVMAGDKKKSKATAYNCYVIDSPKDSREEIIKSLAEMVNIMATGGGVGINLSTIRPRYNHVRGTNSIASGAVSWGGLFSYTTGLIEQAGSRRGALMAMLAVWHPDIHEFINSKRTAGQITNANISVCITDAFMDAVKADGEWELIFPDTAHPDYNWEWDGDINLWLGKGYPVVVHERLKARTLWREIIESAHASAEPGIWFEDRSNHYSNSQHYNRLIATNPCVVGSTRVPSSFGLTRALDMQLATEIATDARRSDDPTYKPTSGMFLTGHKTVYHLATREGFSLTATPDHLISTPVGWVALANLKQGDLIHVGNYTAQNWGDYGTYEMGQILGWYVGDGTSYDATAVLYFYGAKHDLANHYLAAVNTCVPPIANETPHTIWQNPKYDGWRIKSTRLYALLQSMGVNHENKLRIPSTVWAGSQDYVRGFLSALFDADGSVQDSGSSRNVRLSSISLSMLMDIQLLLLQFNINSRIYRNRSDAKLKLMPNGNGDYSEYWCNAVHELNISKSNLIQFAKEINFTLPHKRNRLEGIITTHNLQPEPFVARVESVTAEERAVPVYDLTEPQTSSFIANGIVVHNCGEQPLPANGVCNLGAINLARFYDADNHDIAWERLRATVRTAIRFLDNVIDYTPYVNRQVHDNQLAERRIGLGSMGFAELLIKLKIRYGSDESIALIDKLFAFIAITAYRASADLCQEWLNPFPMYDPIMLESPYMQNLFQADPTLKDYIIQAGGLANVTLLTQAPTGTTGTMLNTSTGLEPFFAWSHTRTGRLGEHTVQVPLVADYFAQNPNATALPDYFVTAMELTPHEHVRVQAAFQRWIDSAVSKTCNVPNNYTVEQVAEIYEYMYELGCKGGTIYRDGSRSEQVLTPTQEPLRLGNVCPNCAQDTLQPEGNCLTCINPTCGYSVCQI